MLSAVKNYNLQYKSIIALGIPIIIGQLGNIVTGFADTIMVGQHSTEELAAASFVNNVINAFIVIGTGFSFSIIPMLGEGLAKKNYHAMGGWLKNSVAANMTTTVFIMLILAAIFMNIDMLGQPEELMPLIRPYYIVTFMSVVFVMLANSFRQFVEGIGNPSVSMWILLSGNILNIIGNYILIYGKFGAPELGLYGAGISTLTSRIIMFLMFLIVYLKRDSYAHYREGFVSTPLTKKAWRQLNALGWPIAIQQGLEAGTFCITAIMVGWLGYMQLAAHQIVITISTISFTTYLGLGSAVAIRASYFKGMNDWTMVRNITMAGIHLALVVMLVVCLSLFLLQDYLGFIFTDDVRVNDIVKTILPILMLYQLGDCIQIILTNALRGLADVKTIMCISFVAYFVIAIPCGYLCGFPFGMGIAGIWLAYPIGFVCSVFLLGMRMKRLIGMNMNKTI